MWWSDDDEDLRRVDGVEPLPAIGPWMQVVTGGRGWFLGGPREATRGAPATEPPPAIAPPGQALAPPRPAPGAPATLRQLGVPGELAHDLEVALRAMGATAGGRVVGFTFRTLDDARHEVVLEAPDRAA